MSLTEVQHRTTRTNVERHEFYGPDQKLIEEVAQFLGENAGRKIMKVQLYPHRSAESDYMVTITIDCSEE